MVQIFLIVTLVSKASYLALISLSTAMILLPYLFSALYSFKLVAREGREPQGTRRPVDLSVAALASVYCLWLLYAAGAKYLLLSALLYAPGAALYFIAKRQARKQPFTASEKAMLAAVVVLALVAGWMLATGQLSL